MKRAQWSENEKFIVMADKVTNKMYGYCKSDYPAYLDWKVLKTVIENVVKGQLPDSYYHDGEYVNLGLTKSEISKLFDKIEKGILDTSMKVMISRLGLRNLKMR